MAGVNHGREELEYAAKVEYGRSRFIGLYAGHEIGDHIYGRMKAAGQNFKLGAKGLDRIEIASEGKGVVAEQVAYNSLEEFAHQERALTIGMRHLTVGLALGVDGKPRTFTEVYKIAEPIFRMYSDRLSGDSKSAAYNLLSMRSMKGTSGRGAAYLKDFVYAEGIRRYWLLAQQNPELLPYLNEFRADLSSPRHIMILQTLGLLPRFTSENDNE